MLRKPKLPKFVEATRAKGRVYYYFKARRKRLAKLPGDPDSAEFHFAYATALEAFLSSPVRVAHSESSVGWLIEQYRASSEFQDLKQKTKVSYERELERLSVIAAHPIADVRRKHITAIRKSLAQKDRTQQLIGQVCSLLWNFGIRELDLEVQNPAQKMRRSGKAKRYSAWSEAEMAKFEAGNPPRHVMTAYMIARYTGPRRYDVVHLTRAHYDGQQMLVAGTKTNTPSRVHVHPRLRSYLDALPPAMFLVADLNGAPVSVDRISKDMRTYLDGLGYPHLSLHGLRHTAGQALAEAGCSPHEIAAVLGHNTLQMVERYTDQVRRERLAKAAIIKLERRQKR